MKVSMTSGPSTRWLSLEPWSAVSDVVSPGPAAGSRRALGRGEFLGRILVGPLALLSLAVVLVFYVWFESSVVEGDSMYPTLRDQDRVLCTRRFDAPRRGQVVIFDLLDSRTGETERLIKRVIALPGDTIAVEQGIASVNGVTEDVTHRITDPRDVGIRGAYVVPPGTVFVLGDNRPVSLDSRQLGPIRLRAIEGEVTWVWAPIHRAGRVR